MKKFFPIYLLIVALFSGAWSTSDNNVSLGDGAASSKTITANKGSGATNPKVRFNNASSFWDFTNDGTNFFALTGLSATQILTNKTIDGDNNTLQDIGIGSLKTDAGNPNVAIIRNGSGVVVNGNPVPNGDPFVTTTATQTLQGKSISGVDNTVEDMTFSIFAPDAPNANKLVKLDGFGNVSVGNNTIPNNDPLVTTTATQDLSSKELTAPLVDDYLDINEESAPSTPGSNVVRIYAKSDAKLYKKDDAGIESELGGGGSGAGEPNVITNPSDATNWAASNTGITVATTTTGTDLPLGGISNTAIKITPVSGTDYVRYRWTMPAALKNKKLKAEWFQRPLSGYASGDLKFEVYKNSASNYAGSYTEFDLSTDASGTTAIPNATGKFTSVFDADDADYYEIRYVRTAGTTALNLASVVVGPGVQPQGAVIGSWINFTPTGSWISNTTYSGRYRQSGQDAEIEYFLQLTGVPTSATLSVNPPSGLTVDTSALNLASGQRLAVGMAEVINNGTGNRYFGVPTYTFGDADFIIRTWDQTTSSILNLNSQVAVNASNPVVHGNSDSIRIRIKVPISQWAGSGTVNLVQNDIEYAATNGTWAANDSSTIYGPNGAAMGGATGGNRQKTITWQTPIQSTDRVEVQGSTDRLTWYPLDGMEFSAGTVIRMTNDAAASAAAGFIIGVGSTRTTTIVEFRDKMAIATDGAPNVEWPSSAAYWRVVKFKGGLAVGFGRATTSAYGLSKLYSSEIVSSGGTSYGASDTQVVRFTSVGASNSDVTVLDSSSSGTRYQIATAGTYSINLGLTFTGGAGFAIGYNVSSLSANISSTDAPAQYIAYATASASNVAPVLSVVKRCAAGDVIYPMADTTARSSGRPNGNQFRIIKIAD